jgi:hypothetical protein
MSMIGRDRKFKLPFLLWPNRSRGSVYLISVSIRVQKRKVGERTNVREEIRGELFISISIPEGKNKAGDLEKKSSKIAAEFRTGSDLTGTDWLLCCQKACQIVACPEFRVWRPRFSAVQTNLY